MPQVFGRNYSVDELTRLVGTMKQVAGIQIVDLVEARTRGLRAAEVYTGEGLRFEVWLDRGLSIGAAEFQGKPLAWLYPALGTGEFYEPMGYGWLRTFGGGLVTTCGLAHFGQPETDGSEHLGLHGRISNMPAEKISITEEWRGQDYVLEVCGEAREAALAHENLLLKRKISTHLGATSLLIEDTVRNDGFRPAPHMILYHCNFGFPVVSPDSELVVNDELVIPRDEAARAGIATHAHFDQPDPGFAEQVFFHKPRPGTDGFVQANIINRGLNFGVFMRYRAAELPYLGQWKMMGAGEYVCALEPANQWETPRHTLREEGRLKFLAPGEEVHYYLEIGVLLDTKVERRTFPRP